MIEILIYCCLCLFNESCLFVCVSCLCCIEKCMFFCAHVCFVSIHVCFVYLLLLSAEISAVEFGTVTWVGVVCSFGTGFIPVNRTKKEKNKHE